MFNNQNDEDNTQDVDIDTDEPKGLSETELDAVSGGLMRKHFTSHRTSQESNNLISSVPGFTDEQLQKALEARLG